MSDQPPTVGTDDKQMHMMQSDAVVEMNEVNNKKPDDSQDDVHHKNEKQSEEENNDVSVIPLDQDPRAPSPIITTPPGPEEMKPSEATIKVPRSTEDVLHGLGHQTDFGRGANAGSNTIITEIPPTNTGGGTFDVTSLQIGTGDMVTIRWWHNHCIHQCDETFNKVPNGICSGDAKERGEFSHVFVDPGVYYFASTTTPSLTLTVNVKTPEQVLQQKVMRYLLGALLFIGVTATIIWYASTYMQQQDFLLPDKDDPDTVNEYEGRKEMRDIFIKYAFPWWAFSIVFALVALMARCFACCASVKMKDFGRGFTVWQRRRVQVCLFALAVTVVGVTLSFWGTMLKSNYAFSNVMRTVSVAVNGSVNEVLSIVDGLKFLIANSATLLPGFVVPSSAQTLLSDVETMSSDVKEWSDHGEEIFRALFRFVAIIMFFGLQIVLYSAALSIAAVYRRQPRLSRTAAWFACVGIVFISATIGATWLVYKFVQRSAVTSEEFAAGTLTEGSLQRTTGLSDDSSLLKMLSACTGTGVFSPTFLGDLINDGIADINRKLKSVSGLEGHTISLEPMNFTAITSERLMSYVDFIGANVAQLDVVLANEETAALVQAHIPQLTSDVMPLVRTAVSIARSVASLYDCRVMRRALTDALPVINDDLIPGQKDQINLQIGIFILTFLLLPCTAIAAYVFARPYKLWYSPLTERWFMFRSSFKAHMRLIAARGVPMKDVKWKSLPYSMLSFVQEAFILNIVHCCMVLLQAMLLVVLHNSYEENQLSASMQGVAFLCIVGPMLSLMSMSSSIPDIRVKRVLRIVSVIAVMCACIISWSYVKTTVDTAVKCYNTVQDNRETNTTGYPFSDECAIDEIMRRFEISIYNSVAGFVCFLALVTGVITTVNIGSLSKDADSVVSGAATARMNAKTEKTVKGFLTNPKNIAIAKNGAFIGASVLSVMFACVFLYSETVNRETVEGSFVIPREGCNGIKEMCSARLDKTTFFCSHNSFSSLDSNFITPNHYYNMDTQLSAGVRALMIDIWNHTSNGVTKPYLCHGVCGLGSTRLLDGLRVMSDFIATNKSEVLILLIEQYSVTSDVVQDFDDSGLSQYVWTPTSKPSDPTFVWPTMQELIDSNKRVLVFTDLSDTHRHNENAPSWYLYMWDYFFETKYSFQTTSAFDCQPNRGYSTDSGVMSRKLSILNHFLTNPVASPMLAADANELTSVQDHYSSCQQSWGRTPNVVAFDFWSMGDPLRTIDNINRANL
eukprot:PhM_4_TR7606/c0_g1_i1/m.44916